MSLVNPSGGSCRRTDSLLGDSLYRPGPPRSGVGCATSSLLSSCSGSATPCANGLTACRMRSAYRLRGSGTIAPSPLRRYARAYAYRGLPALASLSMAGSGGSASTQAVTSSERRAGLEKGNAEADPPEFRGRPPPLGKRARRAPSGSAGVVATACMHRGERRNTGNPRRRRSVCANRQPARARPGRLGWREARSTVEAG